WICLFVSSPLIGLSLGWLLTMFFLGFSKKEPEDPIYVDFGTLYTEYVQDKSKADLKYKGKYLILNDWGGNNEEEKYVSYFDGNGSEIIRCYYERPVAFTGGGVYCGAEGFCDGVKNGIVVLKNGRAYRWGGADW